MQRISPSRDGDSQRRQSAMTRNMGFDWERGDFRRGQGLHNDKVRRVPRRTGQIQEGHGGRLMELGAHASEWSVERANVSRAAALPPAERDHPLAKGSNNTHTHAPPHALSTRSQQPSKL
jgi:hypothetical protein